MLTERWVKGDGPVFKSFNVKNYKNLSAIDIGFKRINLLVGPNNSGKTNLIDAVSFLPDLALSDKKENVFYTEVFGRGFDNILNKQCSRPGLVKMNWVLQTDQQYPELSYDLEFQVSNEIKSFYITHEQLSYREAVKGNEPFKYFDCQQKVLGKGSFSVREKPSKKPNNVILDVDMYETVFAQVPSLLNSDRFRVELYPNFNQVIQTVKKLVGRFHAYSSTQFDLPAIRSPITFEVNQKSLERHGKNFVNVLSYLDDNLDFLDEYTSLLQELMPDLERLKVVSFSDTKREVLLSINGAQYKLHEVSDGTIKAMLLALLLWQPEEFPEYTGMLALDEPELNLHPAWLRVIANWIVRLPSSKQLFLSTHSPDFLDGFTEAFKNDDVALFVFSLDGEETVKQLSPAKLANQFREGWELGDLYRTGDPLLGGWPW